MWSDARTIVWYSILSCRQEDVSVNRKALIECNHNEPQGGQRPVGIYSLVYELSPVDGKNRHLSKGACESSD